MDSDRFRRVLVAALLLPGLAWAEPSAADRESARTYMAEGRKKRDENDLKAALRAFAAADAIMHVPTTGLEVAKTEVMLGQLVEARDEALRVSRSSPQPGEPAPFAEARATAQKMGDDLEARIPSIRVLLKNAPPGTTVTIDGATMPSVAVGLGRKLDPGNHVVVAAAGATERSINVQVLEREQKDVPIDLGAPAVVQAPVNSEPTQPAPVTVIEPPPSPHKPWTAVGITTLALGGAGLALGAITGAMSISQTNEVKPQCTGTVCPSSLQGKINSAETLATVSDIGFIAGGVLAAVGVVFVIIGATHGSQSHVALGAGPGSVMLSGSF
ncbi:MAG TPA: hypothetical protein VGH28_28825 [Polyangiaceae bacterium]|jgi:hypothetical protein